MSKPPHDTKLFGDVLDAALWTGVAAPESAMRNGDASHAAGECHIREPKLLREIAAARRKSAMLPGRHEDVRELQRCGRTQCYNIYRTRALSSSPGPPVARAAWSSGSRALWNSRRAGSTKARPARRVFGSSGAVSETVTSDTWRHAASVASISTAFAPKLYIGVMMILPNASSAWRSSLHLSRRFVDEGHSEWPGGRHAGPGDAMRQCYSERPRLAGPSTGQDEQAPYSRGGTRLDVRPTSAEIASTSTSPCRPSTGTGRALVGSKRPQLAQESHLRQLGRPRFPCPLIRWQIDRIVLERNQLDPQLVEHGGARPADHVIGLVGGGEPIGSLV